ncbi:MAG: DUF448 domain-containing protein [Streptosporangiales bacterium]|nr:DUF448 domain-containing protein [Streptosporangiales bacterium]
MVERPPQRTCVGCRGRAAKSDLLRVVAVGDVLVPDPRARTPGRGAYLHPALACLDLATRRRAFARALRADGGLDLARVRTFLAGTVPGGESEECDVISAERDATTPRDRRSGMNTKDGSMK